MTIISTSNMIFIGNRPPIDVDESDFDTENAASLIGTYSSFSDLQSVAITNHDVNEDGAIYDDEVAGSDFVTYTLGGTSYTEVPDATITYFATVTENDGTVHTIEVVLVQMTNGDVFVGDMFNLGDLDNLTIRTIELTAPGTTDAAGYNTIQSTNNTFVCYVAGTYIDTETGPKRIETLRVGDFVLTRDNGAQPIRWINSYRVAQPKHQAPICISPGALGPDQPSRRLCVSPQHRILVSSVIAERMFNHKDVLIPAIRLLALPGVSQAPPEKSVRYWHLLLPAHHVIRANGAWAESLLPGTHAMTSLTALKHTLPAVAGAFSLNRLVPKGRAQKQLVARHLRNQKSLLS